MSVRWKGVEDGIFDWSNPKEVLGRWLMRNKITQTFIANVVDGGVQSM